MKSMSLQVPAALGRALEQAATLSRLLTVPAFAQRLDRWAIGRDAEIARFVELVLADWRHGRLSERAAVAQLEAYLAGLERVVRDRLELVPDPRPFPVDEVQEEDRTDVSDRRD